MRNMLQSREDKFDNERLAELARQEAEEDNTRRGHYGVGAALLTKSVYKGNDMYRVYLGRNIDLSGMASKIHAEQMCAYQWLLDTNRLANEATNHVLKLVVVTTGDDCPPPCGHCRQELSGMFTNLEIVAAHPIESSVAEDTTDWVYKTYTLKDLLPDSYTGYQV